MLRRTGDPPLPGRRLPPAVRRELARRHAAATYPATHPDAVHPDAHHRGASVGSDPGGDGTVAVPLPDVLDAAKHQPLTGLTHVVAVAELARCRNVHGAREALVAARQALGPGGRLTLVEPYRRTGRVWGLVAAWSPLWRLVLGLRSDLPLPALVRDAGFTLASVERFTMPTLFPPLRSFCSIVGLVPVPASEVPA